MLCSALHLEQPAPLLLDARSVGSRVLCSLRFVSEWPVFQDRLRANFMLHMEYHPILFLRGVEKNVSFANSSSTMYYNL